MDKALSKSTVSRMWVEKSREQLELLRNRCLADTDWLAILIDGVWLTRELCVVVAVGIDIEGKKQVLDFEQGHSESTTVDSELISRLAQRGVKANEQRRLLVLRDGSAAAVKRMWPEAVQQECLVHAHSNLRDKLRRRDRADPDLRFKALRETQGALAGEEALMSCWISSARAPQRRRGFCDSAGSACWPSTGSTSPRRLTSHF